MRIEGVTGPLTAADPVRSPVQGSASFEEILTKIQGASPEALASAPVRPSAPVQPAVPVTAVAAVAPASLQNPVSAAIRTGQDAGTARAAPMWGPLALVQRFFGWIGSLVTGVVQGVRNGLASLFRGRPSTPAAVPTSGTTATTTTASAPAPAATTVPASGATAASTTLANNGGGSATTARATPVSALLVDPLIDAEVRNPWR